MKRFVDLVVATTVVCGVLFYLILLFAILGDDIP